MRKAFSQARQLNVVISAGFEQSFRSFIMPRMKEVHGIDVEPSIFLSAEALARAIAQKQNPTISLFTLDQGPWAQGKAAGVWQKLDESKIPNLANVYPSYRDADGGGTSVLVYMLGLLYDEEAIKANKIAELNSFFDLWRPEFKNRISIPQFSSTFAFAILSQTQTLLGAKDSSFDAAFAKLKELRPNIRAFTGGAGQILQLLQQREIWLTYAPQNLAKQATAAGLPIGWKLPKEGSVAMSHYMAVPENAPDIDGTNKLVDMMLSAEFQKDLAQRGGWGPINSKTELDPAFAATFPLNKQAIENAIQADWNIYIKNRIDLAERWQREVQS
ncbi:extracellular solute-binding protein [Mesorhizobium sp. SP-1A]|uniref:extracellular solute-binding protein n=1 Tax=Mesorhizobium sp. SP-1A TaxID=3077840 RepID=UPI0028F73CC4|nr:extracellular solute-binding protein [Mesorhizobium sp. SP-1A]